MGTVSIIPSTKYANPVSAAISSTQDWEQEIAQMPGLIHYIDPAKLDADGNGRCRFSGAQIACSTPSLITKVQGTDYNGHPAMRLSGSGLIWSVAPGSVSKSWTVVMVGTLDASKYGGGTGDAVLVSSSGDEGYGMNIRKTPSNFMLQSNRDGNAEDPSVSILPAANVPSLWAGSYDDDKRTSAIYINNPAPVHTASGHSLGSLSGASMSWGLGSDNGRTTDSWRGDIALILIFDRAMHLPISSINMTRLVTVLKANLSV